MEPGLRANGQTDEDNRSNTAAAHGTHTQSAPSGGTVGDELHRRTVGGKRYQGLVEECDRKVDGSHGEQTTRGARKRRRLELIFVGRYGRLHGPGIQGVYRCAAGGSGTGL